MTASGEYVPTWGGTPMALAQTPTLAPHLVGRSAHDRAGVHGDLKRAEIDACGPAHRHVVSTLRNASYYELALVHPRCANPLPDVYASDYHDDLDSMASDATVDIPHGPGLGGAYDWDRLRRLATTTHRFP